MKNKIIIPNVILLTEVERMLKEGMQVTILTKGASMLPFIHGGRDSVVLTGTFQPSKGDIVLAKTTKGDFVLHRIIKIIPAHIILMGDGNLRDTEICRTEDVFGKVITILHNGKETDPYSRWNRVKSTCWSSMRPIRKYLLAIYRRLI